MDIEFAITAWAGCAPGLASPAAWREWAADPHLPEGDATAAVEEMPAMLRRRLGPLGRQAVQTAYDCQQGVLGLPIVFATRYGDAERSLNLLRNHAADDVVSPTDFALSVHNAIGAMYSIARRDSASYTTVTAGRASAAAAVVEAAGLLDDGEPEVLLVCYDAPLPGAYAAFGDEPAASYAWAWRMARPAPDQIVIGLEASAAGSSDEVCRPDLPFGLDAMRFVLSADARMSRGADGTLWTWRRP